MVQRYSCLSPMGLVKHPHERRLYSQASVMQTSVTPASVTQTSNSTVVLFTLFTFTIEGCLDSKLISCTVFFLQKELVNKIYH